LKSLSSVKPPNRLRVCGKLRRSEGGLELWDLLPTQERRRGDSDCPRCLFGVSVHEQGAIASSFFRPNFAPPGHLRTSAGAGSIHLQPFS